VAADRLPIRQTREKRVRTILAYESEYELEYEHGSDLVADILLLRALAGARVLNHALRPFRSSIIPLYSLLYKWNIGTKLLLHILGTAKVGV